MYHISLVHSSVISQWVRLLPYLSYCKQCCYEHQVCISFQIRIFSKVGEKRTSPGVGLLLHGNSIFSFIRNLPTILHSDCTNLYSHQPCKAVGSLFSTPSPPFIVYRFFHDGHSDWCEVIPYCSFVLHL